MVISNGNNEQKCHFENMFSVCFNQPGTVTGGSCCDNYSHNESQHDITKIRQVLLVFDLWIVDLREAEEVISQSVTRQLNVQSCCWIHKCG